MKNQKPLFSGAISLFLCLFVNLTCYAADATWIYKYSTPDNRVAFNDVISVSSGGYLAVGNVLDTETGDTEWDVFISRLDQNGQVLWSRNFSFPGRWRDDLHSVVESSDGGFIATGKVLLDGTDGHGNPAVVSAVLILKVDADGDLLWNKLLKNYASTTSYGARIKATADGHYVIVGEKAAYQFNEQYSVYTFVTFGALITKIDTNGRVIFSRTYYGDWTHSWSWVFHDVVQDSEGSYYAVGSASTAAYSEGIGLGGMLLAKIDSTGGLVWAKKLDYALDGEAVIVGDVGHRILLSGNTLYVTGILGTGQNWMSNPFTLSSFTLSGTRNWTKQYMLNYYDNGTSATSDFIHSGDGNFFIATAQRGKTITKVDPQGDVLWSKSTVESWHPASLALEADNGLVVVGSFYSAWTGTVATVSKYDSNGNSCKDTYDRTYTVAEIEMVNNAVSHNVASCSAGSDEIPAFSGPTLSVEKYCGMPAPPTFVPGIKANGQEDSVIVAQGIPVSITINLASGEKAGENADWWIAVHTPFAPPGAWYTYVYPSGWWPGINLCAQTGLFDLSSYEVLNMTLPVGNYTFYFAIDDPDGAATGPWWGMDSVVVTVE